jgi:hypothetical protein
MSSIFPKVGELYDLEMLLWVLILEIQKSLSKALLTRHFFVFLVNLKMSGPISFGSNPLSQVSSKKITFFLFSIVSGDHDLGECKGFQTHPTAGSSFYSFQSYLMQNVETRFVRF